MKTKITALFLLLNTMCCVSQTDCRYFGQVPPGKIPQIFAPGIISLKDRGELFLTIAPDYSIYYFTHYAHREPYYLNILGVSPSCDNNTITDTASFSHGYMDGEPRFSRMENSFILYRKEEIKNKPIFM